MEKKGIAGKDSNNKLLKTLEEFIYENGHSNEKNMILKIDVEHWEWNSLINIKEDILKQFKYITIEFHFTEEKNETILYYNVLKKLNKNHQAFYCRCHGRDIITTFGTNIICKFLEVSYVIKKDNFISKI